MCPPRGARANHDSLDGLRCNGLLNILAPLIDAVVCRGEIALLKVLLRLAVPLEQVVGQTTLLEVHRLVVVLVLFLFLLDMSGIKLMRAGDDGGDETYEDHCTVLGVI